MNEEQKRRRMELAGAKKPSMNRRMEDHDYKSRQMYLVTMVTEGRLPLFGTVVGDVRVPYGMDGAPHIDLSPMGQALTKEWFGIPTYYPQIRMIALQVMPDHFHGILFVTEELPKALGSVLNGFKTGCRHAFQRLLPVEYAAAKRRRAEHMARSKAEKQARNKAWWGDQLPPADWRNSYGIKSFANCQSDVGILFATGYNDRLLIRQGQLQTWLRYLADNPRRLLVKRQHPEFFRVMRAIAWKGMTFSAIGNLFLLRSPQLLQVQCSRSLTTEQIEERKARFLAQCEKGAVLVSPRISPGEKAIMNAAFDAGFPEIIIKNNGFAPLQKPTGRYFDACASGQLLLLGPTFHNNERKNVTRNECLSMNDIAKVLCQS